MSDTSNTIQQIRHHSRQLVRELKLLKGSYQDSGFSLSECHALFELQTAGELSLMEIAERLRLDKSTSSRLIKSLTKKGLVAVRPSSSDQRSKLFSLNEAGVVATQNNNQLANRQVADALELLSEAEQQQVAESMGLYARALHRSQRQAQFAIRPIEAKDNADVARIIRSVMTEYNAVGNGYSILDPEVDEMHGHYNHERAAFFVISYQGELVGCGGIGPLAGGAEEICELKKMYFYPKARGFGLGKKLLQLCLEQAKNLGYRECYLETIARMNRANQLYQSMGFVALDSPKGQTGHSACENWYSKKL
ncbi:MAG: bifunctional helix-turn-helix transcriptional regulator/GNAT family N-acetyltransferase [Bacteroidota bacterium]